MIAFFLLGLLLGLRHALDPDHLAAVTALSSGDSLGRAVRRGATWGVGHSATLLVVGGVCLLGRWRIPPRLADGLELGVGVMLLMLGADVLRRLRRRRMSWRAHRHGVGPLHLHAHRIDRVAATAAHDHARAAPWRDRALFVGMAHGLAGTAAIVLVALPAAASPWVGLAYIACFGLGSILGMAALSAVITLPFGWLARAAPFTAAHALLQVAIGGAAFVVGGWIVWRSWPAL